ncbi:hypothetical protein NTE_02151 [Candidatus Nitrososphaera evergladensis SR1]|jgi:hypothetical protein|uniref:Uncharacterized protein n=1 Tax=Candidatus Nitrososphaera evergladensis SR1 TaxID=1459636 RepID=A0A075MSS9_9ARCH|nr:hypothetical protein [Candidatus Nitrososphaera evergladensis]AIF84205.1 hypothetical protein NTE_02151 [Candidatus Nitrososphaera evergladensis SR1]
MANARLVIGLILAAATFALALTNTLGGLLAVEAVLRNVALIGTMTIPLAAAAFIVGWNQRSVLMAGLLAASGIAVIIPATIATGFFAFIVVPGPILGVIYGLGILGLGIAKGIKSARAMPPSSPSAATAAR